MEAYAQFVYMSIFMAAALFVGFLLGMAHRRKDDE
jgi:hypothetical protein